MPCIVHEASAVKLCTVSLMCSPISLESDWFRQVLHSPDAKKRYRLVPGDYYCRQQELLRH